MKKIASLPCNSQNLYLTKVFFFVLIHTFNLSEEVRTATKHQFFTALHFEELKIQIQLGIPCPFQGSICDIQMH